MAQGTDKIVPVILSGGSGTRLWPLSRDSFPKQFIGVIDEATPLIRETINRIKDPAHFTPPFVVGNNAHRFLLAEQMRLAGFDTPDLIIEPVARNTAPAITVAALLIQARHGDALMLVLPTDQTITDNTAFSEAVRRAAKVASTGKLVTFGIEPKHPETGYGYIRRGETLDGAANAFDIAAFVEKPDHATAETFLASGDYYWNSGMFLFPAALFLSEMERYQPELLATCKAAVSASKRDLDFQRLDEAAFSRAPSLSVDYGLMEHTKKAAVVSLNCGWSDTGAWDLLWKLAPHDSQGNVGIGPVSLIDTKNSYVRSDDGPLVATFGIENLVVVATKDAVLVAGMDKAQSIKDVVEQLKTSHPDIIGQNCRVYRPWGMYESLNSGERFQVKRITVKPGEKLSLQMHRHRAEHWIVVSGVARVTCDGAEQMLKENESVYIPSGSKHRIENPGPSPLEVIEVQSGSYLGEDDIVRYEDQYGRLEN